MLNVYEYHTNPDVLTKIAAPEFTFDYDTVDNAVEYIREHITGDDVSEEFESIAKVFANQFSKCHTKVAKYGEDCAIYPLGRDKINQWAVHLMCEDNLVSGYVVHYTAHTNFCKDESPFLSNFQPRPNFVRDLIIAGLHTLALIDIND